MYKGHYGAGQRRTGPIIKSLRSSHCGRRVRLRNTVFRTCYNSRYHLSHEYLLHPVGQVFGGMVVHELSNAKDLLRFYREFALQSPDELGTIL